MQESSNSKPQKCCFCCGLDRAVFMIAVLDFFALVSYLSNIFSYVSQRNSMASDRSLVRDYLKTYRPDEKTTKELKEYLDLSAKTDELLKFLLLVMVLILVVVYIPRVFAYRAMRCSKAIGCLLIMQYYQSAVDNNAIPAIVGIAASLVVDILFDIYFCIIQKRYHNEASPPRLNSRGQQVAHQPNNRSFSNDQRMNTAGDSERMILDARDMKKQFESESTDRNSLVVKPQPPASMIIEMPEYLVVGMPVEVEQKQESQNKVNNPQEEIGQVQKSQE
eukprot:403343993